MSFMGLTPKKSKKNRGNSTETTLLEDYQGYWTTPASIKKPPPNPSFERFVVLYQLPEIVKELGGIRSIGNTVVNRQYH
jgi:hypothetical protein